MSSFWNGLRPASFRGVAFDAFEQHSEAGGRRLVRHEFPLRDTPYAEDLGRKAGEWQVEAFILRNRWADYEKARDELREALSAAGPGTLVHPWLGQMQVCVESYTVRETTQEGGYCQFSVTFVEAGSLLEPDVDKDTAAVVEAAADAAEGTMLENFLNTCSMIAEDVEAAVDFVEGVVDKVADYLNAGARILNSVKDTVRHVMALPSKLAGAFLGLVSSALGMGSLFKSGLSGILSGTFSGNSSGTPGTSSSAGAVTNSRPLGSQETEHVGFSADSFDMGGFKALLALRGDAPASSWNAPSTGQVNTRVTTIEDRVYTPIIDYVAAVTVAELARLVANTEFATAEDAMEALSVVAEAIDAVQEAHCADTVYAALDDIRAAITWDIAQRGARLPRLSQASFAATLPALVASYRLYGSCDYADEIVSRNRIRHPGRVPGGVPLEIVRHA